MTQETIKQSKNRVTPTFQQKSAGLSLVIINSATIYYFVNMWQMRPIALANDVIPEGYGSLVLTTVAIIILAEIVLHIVLAIGAIGAGSAPAATAHEKTAVLKATRNAYGVLAFGMMAAIGSVFLEELTPFYTANLAILGFAFAEIVRLASQLFYTRN